MRHLTILHVAKVLLLSVLLYPTWATSTDESQSKSESQEQKVAVMDVIPLTVGNMRGHQMLYKEGWFAVSSSSKAFEYAKNKALISSKTALQQTLRDVSKHAGEYREAIQDDVRDSSNIGKDVVVSGTEASREILEATHAFAKSELVYSRDTFRKATDSFVRGNLSIARRTEEDRQELQNLPGKYFKTLKSDFSNIFDLAESARQRFAGRIDPAWDTAFQRASREFRAEYDKSGTRQNSLLALGPILSGYLKSFYHGLAAPASKTIVKTTVVGTSYVVFLPTTAAAIVAGRTVQSVGLTVWYAGKTGVKIVSPTIEGGLLSGLSLLSLGSVPITYAAGGMIGAVNQVAFTTAGPVAGAAMAATSTAVHTAGYAGLMTYDAVKGATKVVINQTSTGIVLGYNALTAVPTHLLLGVTDAAVFLAWDGPRLVIAAAGGRIKTGTDAEPGEVYSMGELPIGTVVDLKQLGSTAGVTVEILSTDNAVIKEVLERIPEDARVTHENAP